MSDVELSDGSRLEIRPIRGGDRAGLAAGFERLSELSRYRRFLSPTGRLSTAQLAYLTEVDHHDHEALVAVEPTSRHGLGVASYVRSGEEAEEAEAAVAVADDWQGHGLGTLRAREESITRFTGLVLESNEPMRQLLRTLGDVQERASPGGTIEVRLHIPEDPLGEDQGRLAGWMRAAARGLLSTRLQGAHGDGRAPAARAPASLPRGER